jgi:hypothetical protein
MQGKVYAVALLALMAAVAIAFGRTAGNHPFAYDEADYMYAATRGLAANYLDNPSMSLVEFIRKGLELTNDPGQVRSMSDYVRGSGDITFYRHYHGPMYAYWLGLGKLAGLETPAAFRASGLAIHLAGAALVFWLTPLVFPAVPRIGAFVGAVVFLLNRTSVYTATAITQHVLFVTWTAVALFLMARFCRDFDRRYWYGSMAAVGLALATVETAAVLAAAVVVTFVIAARPLGIRTLLSLGGKGLLAMLAALLVVWPKGVLELGAVKGYLYLGYMAVGRKTLIPNTPLELWAGRFLTYPYEFAPLALALIAALLLWRTHPHRRELTPFFIYAGGFTFATMIVTIPFTHYYPSLMITLSVIAGVAFGQIWRRWGRVAAAASGAALAASLVWMVSAYYAEARLWQRTPPVTVGALEHISAAGSEGKTWYIPALLTPTVHFHRPYAITIAYESFTPQSLADALTKQGDAAELLCAPQVCEAVRKQLRSEASMKPIAQPAYGVDGLFALTVKQGE